MAKEPPDAVYIGQPARTQSRVEQRRERCFWRSRWKIPSPDPRLLLPSYPVSPLREDWSQYLSTLLFEGGDIWVNPSDCPSRKYQVTFFMWHLVRISFRARLGHITSMLNSLVDTVNVVIIFVSTEIRNRG